MPERAHELIENGKKSRHCRDEEKEEEEGGQKPWGYRWVRNMGIKDT